jgi:hypothetical protein
MQNTVIIEEVSVEKSKNDPPEKERDFLSDLIPIQLDWSLEERIKIAEMSLNPRQEPRELKISESARKAIRDELMRHEHTKTR